MSKKHFIALADAIRIHNNLHHGIVGSNEFGPEQLRTLADFCRAMNGRFNRERWLSYIAGECGPNGGAIKKSAARAEREAA